MIEFGVRSERELIPNGKEIAVTESNRLRYIFLLANDRLNNSIKAQSKAFVSGLYEVIKREWLQLFNEASPSRSI